MQGSANLIQTLLRHNLVDEFRIWVFRVVLGTGKRLFGSGAIRSSSSSVTRTRIMHPLAPKLLVARMLRSQLNVAVAAGAHVMNRVNLLWAMQTLEAASIIGLIHRTTAFEAFQEERVDGEEVALQDARRLRPQELASAVLEPRWRRLDPRLPH